MTLIILSYLAGILTIVSPCILPVLPFVFASAGGPFHRNGLPLLIGLALTFVAFASVATVGGGWIVQANELGRDVALVVLALFGLTLLIPSLADRITRPLVRLGGRLSETGEAQRGIWKPLLLGVATGLLWAPCAGPILGLILTGAALQGASAKTVALLLAYAAGSATSLAIALAAGGRFLGAMKRSLAFDEWLKRALGVAVLAGVALIAFGADRGILTRLSTTNTAVIEQWLLDKARQRPRHDWKRPGDDRQRTRDDGQRTRDDRFDGGQWQRDDVLGERVGGDAGRRHARRAEGRQCLVQLGTARCGEAQGQGRRHRLLDLFLHQLPAQPALRQSLGRQVQGPGPGRDRRARAGVRVRARPG
jgi:cytochrome c biogenesis protein CcdA